MNLAALRQPRIAPRSTGKPAASFPGAVATDAKLAIAVDRQQTKLASSMSALDTSMNVADASGIVAWSLLSIENEIVQVTGAPTGTTVPVSRAFDGTAAATHLAGATVSGLVDAWHHNALVAEVEAIETVLGPNLSLLPSAGLLVSTDYKFGPIVSGAGVTVSGGNLVAGTNVLTFATVPKGVNGTDVDHYLYIDGGTGTPEPVKITGGSGTAGQANGQIIVTCANTHSGAWQISTASNGIAEACSIATTRGGAIILIPAGTHTMRGTVRVTGYTLLKGVGAYNCVLYRTTDYGNTFVGGSASAGFNNVRFEDLFFWHDYGTYTPGPPPSVTNKPTSGAHVQVNGGNTISFGRCRFQNMPIGINIVGGADIQIDDCTFHGLWSPAYASCQISLCDVQTSYDSVLGIPTYIKIRDCSMVGGYRGPSNEVWGPQFRLLCNSCEDLEVLSGAVAASANNGLHFNVSTASYILSNVRITGGVRFDGNTNYDIVVANDGNGSMGDLLIAGNIFNGEKLGLTFNYGRSAIYVGDHGSGTSAIVGLTITDNIIFDFQDSGIQLLDGQQFLIADNLIYMYNLGANAASSIASGISITNRANNGVIQGNTIGGDNTGSNPYGSGNNKCLFGIFVNDPAVAQNHVTLVDNYPPFPAAIGTANDQMFRAYLNRTYWAIENGANNAIAATVANVPLLTGLRVSMQITHTLQAGANTFNFNGTGAKPIRSSRNSGNNIGTAYAANSCITLMYDGSNWQDMSQ